MPDYKNHFSFSIVVGLTYGAMGWLVFQVPLEHALLAALLVVIAESIPDVDENSSVPARELAALLAVVAPVVILELFPGIRDGGMARISVVLILCYLITRVVIARGLQHYTEYRGMVHSIPAAIIAFQVTYLLFWDLYLWDRVFLAGGAFLGFMSHLLVDAWGNLDLVGKAVGNEKKKSPVLKFVGSGWATNLAAYGCMLLLGWFIAKDFYPNLGIEAGLRY